jgi:hypothetical protein
MLLYSRVYLISNEQQICGTLKRLRHGKAPGGSVIGVEHLQHWMTDAKENKSTPEKKGICQQVVQLAQMAITNQPFPRSFEGVPDQYLGIALLEGIYQQISTIINH